MKRFYSLHLCCAYLCNRTWLNYDFLLHVVCAHHIFRTTSIVNFVASFIYPLSQLDTHYVEKAVCVWVGKSNIFKAHNELNAVSYFSKHVFVSLWHVHIQCKNFKKPNSKFSKISKVFFRKEKKEHIYSVLQREILWRIYAICLDNVAQNLVKYTQNLLLLLRILK